MASAASDGTLDATGISDHQCSRYCLMISLISWYEKREIGRLPLRAWRLHSCKAKRRNEAASLLACVRVDDPVFLCIRRSAECRGRMRQLSPPS